MTHLSLPPYTQIIQIHMNTLTNLHMYTLTHLHAYTLTQLHTFTYKHSAHTTIAHMHTHLRVCAQARRACLTVHKRSLDLGYSVSTSRSSRPMRMRRSPRRAGRYYTDACSRTRVDTHVHEHISTQVHSYTDTSIPGYKCWRLKVHG